MSFLILIGYEVASVGSVVYLPLYYSFEHCVGICEDECCVMRNADDVAVYICVHEYIGRWVLLYCVLVLW